MATNFLISKAYESSYTAVPALASIVLLFFGVWFALKSRLFARRSAVQGPREPVPSVTTDDLERIVRRDFTGVQFENVMAILMEYTSQRESSAVRVRIAVLKLANGSLDLLRKHIAAAKQGLS